MNKFIKTKLYWKLKIKHGFPFLWENFSTAWKYIILTPWNFYEKWWFKFEEKKAKYYNWTFPESYITKKWDVVVAMTEQAPWLLWSAWFIPENDKFLHNQRIWLVEVKESELDKNFTCYLFNTDTVRRQLRLSSSWTKVKHTSPDRIYDVEVFIPSDVIYQKKIADFIRKLELKIEVNNKIATELENITKNLYNYWFLQFDFPNENRKPYKSNGGKMVWSDELKRDIPKWWKAENLKNNSLTNLIKPGIDKFDNEKTYLATADVKDSDVNFGADKVTFENRESRANMQPIKNSIWFAKMKNSKKVLYFWDYSNHFLENFILSTGFAGLECKEKYYLEYIWEVINNDNFEMIKDRLSNWATQEAINNDSMVFIPLVVPSEEILKEYHKKTSEIHKKIYLNQIENQKLTELRDWLLPMLMNGQVAVK